MSILITALVLMTLLCLLLGWACYRSFSSIELIRESEESRRMELFEEKAEIARDLSDVLRILNSNVGGISKRISESAEIAEALQANVPDLFKRCDGLAYWLHANDQFLVNLYAVVAEGLDKRHQQRVHEMTSSGREEIFAKIYTTAGLPAPKLAVAK